MKNILNKKNLVYIALYIAVLPVLALLVRPGTAHAEAPHCFLKTTDQSAAFKQSDCGAVEMKLAFQLNSVQPVDDKCYAATASLGGPVGVGFSLEQQPYSTDPASACGQWLQEAGVTASSPAKCVLIDGSEGEWNKGNVQDLTKLHANIKCDDYVQKIQDSGQIVHFEPGNCYLIFNDNSKFNYTGSTCGLALTELITRQTMSHAGKVIVDAERDTVIHCGEHPGETATTCIQANPLVKTVNNVIDFVSAGIGVIVVIMVIIGGIQYVTAGNNPQAVTAAKKRISNALIALVAFMLLFAFMSWLLPGGFL